MGNDCPQQDLVNNALIEACECFEDSVNAEYYQYNLIALLFFKYISNEWEFCNEATQSMADCSNEERIALLRKKGVFIPQKIILCDLDGNQIEELRTTFNNLYRYRFHEQNGARFEMMLRVIVEANQGEWNPLTSWYEENNEHLFGAFPPHNYLINDPHKEDEVFGELLSILGRDLFNPYPSFEENAQLLRDGLCFLFDRFSTESNESKAHYTPPQVTQLMVGLLQPNNGEMICDPMCGLGSFLTESGHWIRNHSPREKLTYQLFGQELKKNYARLAEINLWMHGEKHFTIKTGDLIRKPALLDDNHNLHYFDLILAHPPFVADKWGEDFAKNDPYKRFERGIPLKSRGSFAYILHMIETLNPKNGRMAVIMPHGVLFREGREGAIRRQLIEENLLDAIISLPEKLFYESTIPSVILIFKKNRQCDDVLLIDASHQYSAGKRFNRLNEEAINAMIKAYHSDKLIDRYSYRISQDAIKAHRYNLNLSLYLDRDRKEKSIDINALHSENRELKEMLIDLEVRKKSLLDDLIH